MGNEYSSIEGKTCYKLDVDLLLAVDVSSFMLLSRDGTVALTCLLHHGVDKAHLKPHPLNLGPGRTMSWVYLGRPYTSAITIHGLENDHS